MKKKKEKKKKSVTRRRIFSFFLLLFFVGFFFPFFFFFSLMKSLGIQNIELNENAESFPGEAQRRLLSSLLLLLGFSLHCTGLLGAHPITLRKYAHMYTEWGG